MLIDVGLAPSAGSTPPTVTPKQNERDSDSGPGRPVLTKDEIVVEENRPLSAAPSTVDELFTWIQATRKQLVGHESEPIGASGKAMLPVASSDADPSHVTIRLHRPALAYTIQEQFLGHLKTFCPDKWVEWYRQFDPKTFRTVLDLDAMMAWVEQRIAPMTSPTNPTNGAVMNAGDDLKSHKYDVFLSHNSKDKAAVRELKRQLALQGLSVWYDEDELRPGIPWQRRIEEGITASRSIAVLVGNDGLGPREDEEMQGALRLATKDRRPVIPVLLPGAPSEPSLPMFLSNRTWVDLRGGYTCDGFEKLVWGITGKKPSP
ncbi:MAG: toll/interleukin-1 receptor domain-containing protein [Thermoguttaceae bacterium]